MPNPNFMLADWLAILVSFSLFPLLTVVPGYAFGWLLDILRFRQRTLWFRLTLSVPLSIALGPILSYLVARLLSLGAAEVVYGVLCLYVLFLAVGGWRSRPHPLLPFLKARGGVLVAALIWLVVALLMLADIQFGGRLYYPVIGFDYEVRTAIVSSLDAFGIPAQDPFYFPGHGVGLRYHYLWLIQCALLARLGSPFVEARHALIGGTMWCGIGMLCLVPLYLRLFSPLGAARLYRRTLVGLGLMGVIGVDILPALLKLRLYFTGTIQGVSPSVEWWNEQVDGWIYTMLWEPHYICSLIACLTAFLILWDVPEEARRRRWMISGAVAGLALATAVGAGIYVAFVFAIFLAVWTCLAWIHKWRAAASNIPETLPLIVAGVVAAVASLPYFLELRGPPGGGATGQASMPIQFTVRAFDDLISWNKVYDHTWQILLTRAALLPLNYFMELGFFFAVGCLVWKHFRAQKRAPTRQEWASFAMAGTSILICTFMKSSVVENNDLGWRGFLPAQFILLLWAADLLRGESATANERLLPAIALREHPYMIALLILGAAGTVYDLAILRFYPVWSDKEWLPKVSWMSRDDELGRRTYAGREAYGWLKSRTSSQSILLQNLNESYLDTPYGLYANRQTIAEDPTCTAPFATDLRLCAPIVERFNGLFASGASSQSFQNVCENLPIDVVVAKDTDAAWGDRASWIWSREPIFSNHYFRLFPCRSEWRELVKKERTAALEPEKRH